VLILACKGCLLTDYLPLVLHVAQIPKSLGHNVLATFSALSWVDPQKWQCHKHWLDWDLESVQTKKNIFTLFEELKQFFFYTNYRTCGVQLSCLDVVNERDVILWMPIFAVANRIKCYTFQKLVDWCNNLDFSHWKFIIFLQIMRIN